MPAGRLGESAIFIFIFEFPRFNFLEWGARGKVLGGSLPSAGALLICTSAGWEGEHEELLYVALPPFHFSLTGGGESGFRWIYTIRSAAFGMHASGS